MIDLTIVVEDVNTKMEDFDQLVLYRSTSATGTYSEIDHTTLVADDPYYAFEDALGSVDSWYQYLFRNSGTSAVSTFTDPFRPEGVSRKQIRQGGIKQYRAGRVFSSLASGSTTAVIATDDYFVHTPVFPAGRGKNAYLIKSTGANRSEVRIISDSSPTAGTFTVSPVLSSIPADLDEWEWHWLVPPEEWDRAINRGLRRYIFLDRVPIVGIADTNEYALSDLPWLRQKKQVTGLWWTPESALVEEKWSGGGRWYDIRQDQGALTMKIVGLQEDVTVQMEVLREAEPLYTDDSVVPNNLDFDLIVAFAYDEVLSWLIQVGHGGTNIDRDGWKDMRRLHQPRLNTLIETNRPQPTYAMPTSSRPRVGPRPFKAR